MSSPRSRTGIAAALLLLLGALDAVAESPPGILWRAATGGQIRSRPAVGPDGTIYALSEDSFLYAWAPGGSLRWTLDLGAMPADCLAVSPEDGTVYAGLRSGELIAVNTYGARLWTVKLDGLPAGDPAVTREGAVLVGTSAGTLAALSHLGRRAWAITLPGAVTGQPAIDGAGTIYVVSADQRLYALTPWGEFKWSLPLGSQGGAPSIAPGGDAVLGTAAGDLVDVTPGGEIRWKRSLGSTLIAPAMTSGEIVAGTAAGAIVDFAADGTEHWRSSIPRRPAQLFATGGDILVAAEDGTVFTLRAGAIASTFSPGTAGGTVLDSAGVPILGGRNWVIHALDRAALGLPPPPSPTAGGPGPWPQAGHDWMHSGRTDEAPPSGNDSLLALNPDYLFLQGIAAGGDRDSIQLVLKEISARVDGGSLGKSRWYATQMLERIAGSGVILQVRQSQRLVNDYPDLRAAAAALLGRIGSVASRTALLRVVEAETDGVALAAEVRALGAIASDGDGSSARAIARAFTRTAALGPDGRLAAAVVDALGRIAVYEGSLGETSAMLALSAITRGPYDATTRQRAVAVLQGEPKVDILDVEE